MKVKEVIEAILTKACGERRIEPTCDRLVIGDPQNSLWNLPYLNGRRTCCQNSHYLLHVRLLYSLLMSQSIAFSIQAFQNCQSCTPLPSK